LGLQSNISKITNLNTKNINIENEFGNSIKIIGYTRIQKLMDCGGTYIRCIAIIIIFVLGIFIIRINIISLSKNKKRLN
jgi:hypothetical protein